VTGNTGVNGGTSLTSLGVSLRTALADQTNNAQVTAVGHSHAEGSTTTDSEIADTNASGAAFALETQYRVGGSAVMQTASWASSSNAWGITFEIAAAQSSPTWNKIGLLVGGEGVQSSTPSDPAAITSATAKMCGLAVAFTPKTTRVRITIDGAMSNGANNASSSVDLRTGTGTAPINNAAATGTVAGAAVTYSSAGISAPLPFSLSRIVTGLTIGTAIWVDLSVLTASSTIQPKNLTVTVEDV
jgi:hypothetical protein